MRQGIARRERTGSWLRQLNTDMGNWILSLSPPWRSPVMLDRLLKTSVSQVVTNCLFLIFWLPVLRQWGLICRGAQHLQLQLSQWELGIVYNVSYSAQFSGKSGPRHFNGKPKPVDTFELNLSVAQFSF